ncbi:MAG: glycosyltransferase family 4 protein [Lachnospiraceae bacterium]|nr:glycosyltransferase family 4 protein [Lachnospiraceae bacterium]
MKVLIISHTPMNMEDNNGRTLTTLFSQFSKEDIAQLYFREENPNAKICEKYFCITDFEIVNSILKFRKPGRVRENSEDNKDIERKEKTYGKYSKKRPFVRFVRDFMWGLNTWKTKEFKEWLVEFNPDIIFFYASDSVFSQKIARWVSVFLQKKMVLYWVDDFYLKLKNARGIFEGINNWRFKKIAKKNIASSTNACITDLMAKAYENEFGKKFHVIYNTSNNKAYPDKKIEKPLKFAYLGNISLGRNDSLAKIGRTIVDNKLPIILDVYSAEKREEILLGIIDKPGVNFHGGVSYEEVKCIMENSDVILHVEGFEKENIQFAKYSLSTKIADCLVSNRCIMCFGPREVASVDYLIREKCAIVATDEKTLLMQLAQICDSPRILVETAKKAVEIGKKNHTAIGNGERLMALLEEAY